MNIYLVKMTKPLQRHFFQGFTNDPDIYMDMSRFSEYSYCEANADAHWEKQQKLGRIHMAVMLDQMPIGEVILKDIITEAKQCTLSIHMQNDSFKNRGYGTQAEMLTLEYAFTALNMETVFADAIHKNKRSQHVLEKVGFQKTGSDEQFVYYRCDKEAWCRCHRADNPA